MEVADGRFRVVAWWVMALPWAVLTVLMLVPGTRGLLLGPRPPRARMLAMVSAAERRSTRIEEFPSPTPARAAVPMATKIAVAAGPTQVPSPFVTTPSLTPIPVATVPTPTPEAQWLELTGDEITQFLEESYRAVLPRGTGPFRTRVENGVLHIDGTIDLDGLRSDLGLELPMMLGRLVRGETTLAMSGQVIDSGDGIVRFQLLGVQVGVVSLPNRTLGEFLRMELVRRGLEVQDPLIRPLRLPAAYAELRTEGDKLRLRRHASR